MAFCLTSPKSIPDILITDTYVNIYVKKLGCGSVSVCR